MAIRNSLVRGAATAKIGFVGGTSPVDFGVRKVMTGFITSPMISSTGAVVKTAPSRLWR